jgi:hypothetical protein
MKAPVDSSLIEDVCLKVMHSEEEPIVNVGFFPTLNVSYPRGS